MLRKIRGFSLGRWLLDRIRPYSWAHSSKKLCWCKPNGANAACNDYCCGHRWTKGDWD